MQVEKCLKKKSLLQKSKQKINWNKSLHKSLFSFLRDLFYFSIVSPYCWLPRYVFILFHFISNACLFCLCYIPKQCGPPRLSLCKRREVWTFAIFEERGVLKIFLLREKFLEKKGLFLKGVGVLILKTNVTLKEVNHKSIVIKG